MDPRQRVVPPTVTPRQRVVPPTVTPRQRVVPPTVTPRQRVDTNIGKEKYDEHNINLLPNEIQYNIIDNLDFVILQNIMDFIMDPDVKNFALGRYLFLTTTISKLLEKGDLPEVKIYLMYINHLGYNIQFEYEEYRAAVKSGNSQMINWLLDNEYMKSDSIHRIGTLAAEYGYDEILVAELSKHEPLRRFSVRNLTSTGVRFGKINILELLESRGLLDLILEADIIEAVRHEDVNMMRFLADRGGNITEDDIIQFAIDNENEDMIALLAERGAVIPN